MVSSISLGNVVTGSGAAKSSGLASGLDSNALIEDILSVRQSVVDGHQDDIDLNTGKITATDQMFLLLDRFRSSVNLLRDEPGIQNESNFAFNYRTASVTSNGTKDGSSYVDVTATPGASVGEYEISNVTLAKKHTLALSGFTSKNDSAVSGATVSDRFTTTQAETIAGTTLDTTTPITFFPGYDGATATSNASLNVQFGNNQFDAEDIFSVGDTTVTFGADITVGATTEETLQNLANHLNSITSGDEAGYNYSVSGGDTIVIARNIPGSDADIGTSLTVSSDFSAGADATQTVAIGSGVAINGTQSDTVVNSGTDGALYTQASDADTSFTPTLAGDISNLNANFAAGSASGTTGFTPNSVTFTVEVGGETYSSQPIELGNGSLDIDNNGSGDLGNGTNGFGNLIPAGTEIIFTKDTDSDPTAGTTDVSFALKVGDAVTIDDQTGADAFVSATETFLSTNNVKIAQDFDSTNDDDTLIDTSPAVGFREGTFDFEGVDITLNEGDSLLSIRAKINAVAETTGVQAEILQISEDSFTLQLQSTKTGETNDISAYGNGEDGDPEDGRLLFGGSSVAFTQTQAGSDANFNFNGIAVTRESNSINDIVDNVTLTLKSETSVSEPDTDITVSIEPDTDVIYDAVVDLLNNYNDLKFFISEQTETDENGDFTEDAKLANETILSDTLRAVNNEITSSVAGLSGSLNSVFSVGIDFTDYAGDGDLLSTDNIFTLDTDKLKASLQSDYENVKNIFAFNLTSDSTDLSVFSRTNELALNDFKLNIDESRDEGEKVQVLDQDDNFLFFADYTQTKDRFGNVVGSGGTISGRSGTDLAGLVMIYSGDGNDDINVHASQGIADRLYNYLDEALDEETGDLAEFITGLQEANENLTEDITDGEERIDIERNYLVAKFAQLEAAISEANNILRLFSAEETEKNK